MSNVWKLSNYLFRWYWERWGKVLTIVSLCGGVLLFAAMVIPTGNPESATYYSKAFRSYDMAIDGSFLPVVFILGLLLIFILQFAQVKGFSTNHKGIYSIFMLPMKRGEIYLAFLFSMAAAVAVYYLLWLVLLVAAYFPITAWNESAAAKEIIYLSEGVTLTGLDTHMENGLFLAFRRSMFLSTFFPVTLWHVPPLLAGLLLVLTGVMYGCFHTKDIGTCVVVSMIDSLAGAYLILATTLKRAGVFFPFENDRQLSIGSNLVLSLIVLFVVFWQQSTILWNLEEKIEL